MGDERRCNDDVDCNGEETCDEREGECVEGQPTCVDGEICDTRSGDCTSDCEGCVIDGSCYGEGAPSPTDLCFVCDPAASREGWTAATAADCDDGDVCTSNDACDNLGQCTGTPTVDEAEGCACIVDADCDDDLGCTDDTCDEGNCTHRTQPGSCLVDEACIAHNTPDPSNPCRYCDVSLNADGWTNAAIGAACDDGLWCTGLDTCNAGACQHEFVGNERCNENGPCAADTCDEDRDSCYLPAGYICATVETVNRCANDQCGGSSQAVELTRTCTGDAAECPTQASEEVTATTSCASDQACNESTGRCGAALGCGDTYCDSESGLCWMTVDTPFAYTQQNAANYCEDLTLAGSNTWRLPTFDETETIYRGDCTRSCPSGEGLGVNGCYWATELGDCGDNYYWTGDDAIVWIPLAAQSTIYGSESEFMARCVTDDSP